MSLIKKPNELLTFFGRFLSGRAFRYNPSLRAQRGNLLKILLNKLAKPGFSLQSLTKLNCYL